MKISPRTPRAVGILCAVAFALVLFVFTARVEAENFVGDGGRISSGTFDAAGAVDTFENGKKKSTAKDPKKTPKKPKTAKQPKQPKQPKAPKATKQKKQKAQKVQKVKKK